VIYLFKSFQSGLRTIATRNYGIMNTPNPAPIDTPRPETMNHFVLRKPYLVFSLLILAVLIRFAGDITISAAGHDILDDDAYYYTVTASNFAATGQMTFDGHSVTNGYHPLWFWIQVLAYKLGMSRLSVTNQAVAVLCIQYVIFGCTLGAVMWWILRNRRRTSLAAAAMLGLIVLIYPKHTSIFLRGMETVLVLPFLILFLHVTWAARWKWAGAIGCVLVMSRLDTLVYVIAPVIVLTALLKRSSVRLFVKRAFQIGAPPLLVTMALMLTYRITFGHPLPIHGLCRSSFPAVNLQWHHLTEPVSFAFSSGALGLLASINLPTAIIILPVCGLLLCPKGRFSPSQRATALWLVVLGLVQLASFVFFQKWAKPISPWYLAPLIVFSAGAIAAAATHLTGRRAILWACLALAGLLVVLSGVREVRRISLQRLPSRLEHFVEAQGRDAVWAATDCGNISFRTGARFVNLDGLINGFAYQAALRDGKLKAYLEEADVRYLLVGVWQHGPQGGWFEPMYAHRSNRAAFDGDYETFDFYAYSYMYECYSDTLTLVHEQEIWRSSPGLDGTIPARTVVFDLAR
jgi:hypothetical protein